MSADAEIDALVGENPCLPAGSVGSAVLAAMQTSEDIVRHGQNLQAAVDDVRRFIEGKHTVGAIEISNLLTSHHV